MNEQWYISRGQGEEGPVSSARLKQLASTGVLSADDLVWKEGMSQWVPARQVKQLFTSHSGAPPRPSLPPPLPTLEYDDFEESNETDIAHIVRKDSIWLWIGGIVLILAGIGAADRYPTIIATPFLIVAGSLLLPAVWNSVVKKWSSLASHATLIRTSFCVLAFFVLGALKPARLVTPSANRRDEHSDNASSPQQAADDERTSRIVAESVKSAHKSRDNAVTKAEFSRIRNGMSYTDVVGIVGLPGEEISSNHLEGISGVMESVDTVLYSWTNRDGANMNVMFQNDKVVSKAQYGLR